jgi:hypothetical protein
MGELENSSSIYWPLALGINRFFLVLSRVAAISEHPCDPWVHHSYVALQPHVVLPFAFV